MLKHRLIVGTLLAVCIGGVLLLDDRLAPSFPALLLCALLIGVLATRELVNMLPQPGRPSLAFCWAGVLAVLLVNWYPGIATSQNWLTPVDPWRPSLYVFAAVILLTLLREMAMYTEPGQCMTRMSRTIFVVAYLGVLPSFFLRMRWDLPADLAVIGLTLTVFVPKCCDIGAYFTGRLIGKHKFTPVLSPKKTWEGFAGGIMTAMLTAAGLSYVAPVFPAGILEAMGFGFVIGLAGVLGDLAESLIKRDCLTKDADSTIPGFGGILDVIDSILFAAPVAYWWLTRAAH